VDTRFICLIRSRIVFLTKYRSRLTLWKCCYAKFGGGIGYERDCLFGLITADRTCRHGVGNAILCPPICEFSCFHFQIDRGMSCGKGSFPDFS
jgi:hypothetical protein